MNATQHSEPLTHAELMAEALLTPAEVAVRLGVKIQTLSVWRCTGRAGLPFLKVCGAIRYRRSDVEKWLAGRTFTSCAELNAAESVGAIA